MRLIIFNNLICSRTTGWKFFFNAVFTHRAQSIYLKRKSDLLFQIVSYHGDIILKIIYNMQNNIILYHISMLLYYFPQLQIKDLHINYEQIIFVHISATKKWRKQILDLYNSSTAPTIPLFTALHSILKILKHSISNVAFTHVIHMPLLQRLVVIQYLLQ